VFSKVGENNFGIKHTTKLIVLKISQRGRCFVQSEIIGNMLMLSDGRNGLNFRQFYFNMAVTKTTEKASKLHLITYVFQERPHVDTYFQYFRSKKKLPKS
jgi:hypothetical protein